MVLRVYKFGSTAGYNGMSSDTTAADVATMQAAVDVLVADGASPTQAHVNTMVTAWNTVSGSLTTGEGFKITVSDVVYTTKNQIRAQIDKFLLKLQSDDRWS